MYYLSTAATGVTTQDHDDILEASRKNNRQRNVTGLLVVKGGYFAQALEGEKQEVTSLFEKIKEDPRHHRIVHISEEEVSERLFDGWEMGYRNINESEQLSEVDLGDPKFVNNPNELDQVFRRIIEL